MRKLLKVEKGVEDTVNTSYTLMSFNILIVLKQTLGFATGKILHY
jgi:uncharacterized radical SAM superfamily protein